MNKQKKYSITIVWLASFLAMVSIAAIPALANPASISSTENCVPHSGSTDGLPGNLGVAAGGDPARIYAQLHDSGIRYEYAAPGALVTFSIYDSPRGNLLWTGSRCADEIGFAFITFEDHHVELTPGTTITVSVPEGRMKGKLVVKALTFDVFDPDENVLSGTVAPGDWVLTGINNETVSCLTHVKANRSGVWLVDFDDHGCDLTADMSAYAQVFDAEDDTTEIFWLP